MSWYLGISKDTFNRRLAKAFDWPTRSAPTQADVPQFSNVVGPFRSQRAAEGYATDKRYSVVGGNPSLVSDLKRIQRGASLRSDCECPCSACCDNNNCAECFAEDCQDEGCLCGQLEDNPRALPTDYPPKLVKAIELMRRAGQGYWVNNSAEGFILKPKWFGTPETRELHNALMHLVDKNMNTAFYGFRSKTPRPDTRPSRIQTRKGRKLPGVPRYHLEQIQKAGGGVNNVGCSCDCLPCLESDCTNCTCKECHSESCLCKKPGGLRNPLDHVIVAQQMNPVPCCLPLMLAGVNPPGEYTVYYQTSDDRWHAEAGSWDTIDHAIDRAYAYLESYRAQAVKVKDKQSKQVWYKIGPRRNPSFREHKLREEANRAIARQHERAGRAKSAELFDYVAESEKKNKEHARRSGEELKAEFDALEAISDSELDGMPEDELAAHEGRKYYLTGRYDEAMGEADPYQENPQDDSVRGTCDECGLKGELFEFPGKGWLCGFCWERLQESQRAPKNPGAGWHRDRMGDMFSEADQALGAAADYRRTGNDEAALAAIEGAEHSLTRAISEKEAEAVSRNPKVKKRPAKRGYRLHSGGAFCPHCGLRTSQCQTSISKGGPCCCFQCNKRVAKVLKRRNPPGQAQTTEIYKDILAIEARKGNSGEFPGELFRHDFTKKGSRILGVENPGVISVKAGDLVVKGKGRLWKRFAY